MYRLVSKMLIDRSSEIKFVFNCGSRHFVIPFEDMDIHVVLMPEIKKYFILIGDDAYLIQGWGPPDLPEDYPHLMELTAILSEVL